MSDLSGTGLTPTEQRVLADAWRAAGGDVAALGGVSVSGPHRVFPTGDGSGVDIPGFDITAFAASMIAAATLAAAEFHAVRTRTDVEDVVDRPS